MKKLTYTTLTLCAMALLAAPVMAMDHGKGEGKKHGNYFEKVDADKDGKISKQEFLDMHAKKFDKMDADGDGFISKEEKKAMHQKMMERKEKRKEHHEEKDAE